MSSPWWARLRASLAAEQGAAPQADVQTATAVLLHEVAQADFDQCPLEAEQVVAEISAAFGLSLAESEAMRRSSAEVASRTASLHHLIDTLNRSLDADGKRALLARLWRVAYADGTLDPKEEALIRRLADLLFLPHAVFVQERLRAAADAQARSSP